MFVIIAHNKVKAGECGAIDAIVNTMKTHINNADICYRGFRALLNITSNNGKADIVINILFCINSKKSSKSGGMWSY